MNGRVKAADFGIARVEASDLTQTGAVLGSPNGGCRRNWSGAS